MPLGEWIDTGSPIGWPTADDIAYHLTMLFPPVRPRGWMEIRYLDALPSPWWEVATRVVTSLLAVPVSDVTRAVGGTSAMWHEAAHDALNNEPLAQAADRCFALALLETDDAGVADYLERFVARRVPAWA
jgi:glutamate--cysteine ligase